ncbi:non-hydrolyzing UDP-N-acetylglucosamine 2-epimerase [Polynucleobacter sp. UK-Kesae-W10]|uniref:non-hydrolyzing UDP-N-acetylglucosamine 2-epimerase n=1 Tax=Polynucleobacter sp. UK-Kesae-W10 TaxID=1819738 RepID=UPI001C0D7A04|nr:UDP-N-acetylglucosamine 2-epimerase (non-hydrolyzing) [Polynucleobacter sp. UK-Kesae-W10]MBU3576945.1 UDP-N-acetylglucosamine 2-epimerase (non-hydrolyzing) [Polynucleobacter sp. UK-Kesae-W10]
MKKLKVATVIGTRPEIIRLSRVLARLDQTCEHVLIHTGQNYDYELNQIFFDDLGLRKPDYFLDSTKGSNSAAQTIGNLIGAVDGVLDQVRPDALLVLGDTNSCLSVIPAKRRKIPVFHMEAGNRCFDERVPEEINRRIVDHTADINMPYSSIAREYLLREGLPPDSVIKTGSPLYEVLSFYRPKIDVSNVITRLQLKPKEYFLVSAHREENIDNPKLFQQFTEMLNGLANSFDHPIILSAHPRTQKRITESGLSLDPRVSILKPLGFFDYVKLQLNARVVLSDSGSISEEASILNIPALNIREAHERPEAMEEAPVMMVGLNPERIYQAIELLEQDGGSGQKDLRIVSDYQMPNVSEKVVRILHSYTDYVNRTVWKKY